MQKKIVLYTVIIGQYDRLHSLPSIQSNIKCICFTDNQDLMAQGWEVVLLPSVDANNRALVNRSYKFLPWLYFDADQSLYIDGNIQMLSDPSELFDLHLSDADIAIPKHPYRNCAYAEIEECVIQGLVEVESACAFRTILNDNGFPYNQGLYENNVIFRNHNAPKLREAMEMWFSVYKDLVRRDQLSLTYCLWKCQVRHKAVDKGPRYSRRYFNILPHNHHRNLSILKRLRHHIRISSRLNYAYRLVDHLFNIAERVFLRSI